MNNKWRIAKSIDFLLILCLKANRDSSRNGILHIFGNKFGLQLKLEMSVAIDVILLCY